MSRWCKCPAPARGIVPLGVAVSATPLPQRQGHVLKGRVRRLESACLVYARVLPKGDRQRLIASVITRKRVGTQHELLVALAAAGCRVTQATSRVTSASSGS